MNEIEAKRKELEDELYITPRKYGFCSILPKEEFLQTEAELKGFNLGVEMTRREFLEFLYEITEDGEIKYDSNIGERIRNKAIFLKQFLEERK